MSRVGYFLVTSHGWSGSNWLAIALNRHPDILCTHSAANILADGKGGYSKTQEKEASEARSLKPNDERLLLSEYFEQQETLGRARCYGSVHRYRLRDLPALMKHEKNRNLKFQLANLVRHPVNLVASGQGQFTQMAEFDILVRMEILQFFQQSVAFYYELADRYDLDLCDWSVVGFLAAAQHMRVLAHDQECVKGVANLKMEEVTRDHELFRQLVGMISKGELSSTEEYLDEVFDLGSVNRHKKKGRRLSPREQFEEWEEWQQKAFRHFAEESKIEHYYAPFGYDFSFMSGG